MSLSKDVAAHASLVGKDWIASGWEWEPSLTSYADTKKISTSGWWRREIWVADATGGAGFILLECRKPGRFAGVQGWVRTREEPRIDTAGNSVQAGRFRLRFFGEFSGTTSLPGKYAGRANHHLTRIGFPGAELREYRVGEAFTLGLSLGYDNHEAGTVTRLDAPSSVLAMEAKLASGRRYGVAYNGGEKPATWAPPGGKALRAWISTPSGGKPEPLDVMAGAPVSIPARTVVAIQFQ